jgi:sterol desaturase/sphingolipid hydroxylase (fatty acid hydroxylase superfamily)
MDVLILDGWAYFAHRAYHRMPFMWRFHAPHHLDAHLDTTSAGRFHPFEIVLSALIRIPLIMTLGIPFAHALAYDTLLLLAAIFHHSNVRLPDGFERALSRVVVTPAIHWVHHHAVRDDTNSNYSAVFSFWDRLFGTRSSTRRERGMKIGIEGLPDRNLLKLFLAPFESPVR